MYCREEINTLEKVVKKIKNDMDLRVWEMKSKMGLSYPLVDSFTLLVNSSGQEREKFNNLLKRKMEGLEKHDSDSLKNDQEYNSENNSEEEVEENEAAETAESEEEEEEEEEEKEEEKESGSDGEESDSDDEESESDRGKGKVEPKKCKAVEKGIEGVKKRERSRSVRYGVNKK